MITGSGMDVFVGVGLGDGVGTAVGTEVGSGDGVGVTVGPRSAVPVPAEGGVSVITGVAEGAMVGGGDAVGSRGGCVGVGVGAIGDGVFVAATGARAVGTGVGTVNPMPPGDSPASVRSTASWRAAAAARQLVVDHDGVGLDAMDLLPGARVEDHVHPRVPLPDQDLPQRSSHAFGFQRSRGRIDASQGRCYLLPDSGVAALSLNRRQRLDGWINEDGMGRIDLRQHFDEVARERRQGRFLVPTTARAHRRQQDDSRRYGK